MGTKDDDKDGRPDDEDNDFKDDDEETCNPASGGFGGGGKGGGSTGGKGGSSTSGTKGGSTSNSSMPGGGTYSGSASNGGNSQANTATSSLNWDWVSPTGETRREHVALHQSNNLSKPLHGVFYQDAYATINEAWGNKSNGIMIPENSADVYIIPYPNSGYEGGYNGRGINLNHVRIVTQPGTYNIITGYPYDGSTYN
jgi:hypothetical protein